MERITLDVLAPLPCWVAWQTQARKVGIKPTKVPFNPRANTAAKADDPATWGTRPEAEARAARLAKPFGAGGVGIEFAPLADGRNTGGIDLDTCRDPETGEIEAWAQSVIDRFRSYTEVSPSGTGVKLFFTYRTADATQLRAAMGTDSKGQPLFSTTWKRGGGSHPPAIELHLGHRYFCVTDAILPGCTDELVEVPTAEIMRLITVEGPAFVPKATLLSGEKGLPAKRWTAVQDANLHLESGPAPAGSGGTDNSRSAIAFRIGAHHHRRGLRFEAFAEALRTHPDTAEWFTESGGAGGRQVARIWEKTSLCEGDLILQPSAPVVSARTYIVRNHTAGDLPTLHHQNATFYTWEGPLYLERTTEEMRARLYRFLDGAKRYDEDMRLVPFDPNKNKVANVLEALAAEAQLGKEVRAPTWISKVGEVPPPAGELIACTNGLLHLPTMRLYPVTPAFFNLNALEFAYQAAAGDPGEWLKFLSTLWPDDQESIDTLQELFGLLLTGETKFQKIFLIVGPKRSGKGTIARVLTKLIGAANVCSPTLSSLQGTFGMETLIGKRLALISDARLSGKADQAIITERLLSISGEDSASVDRKNRTAWFGKLDARFVILSNELPKLTDHSGALAGRFITLQMVNSFFGMEDLALGTKLEAELPQILLWAADGWKRVNERGYFMTPASAMQAQQNLEDLSSPTSVFIREYLEVGAGFEIPAKRVYALWGEWCSGQGRDHIGTSQSLGRDMGTVIAGLETKQKSVQGERAYYYLGVREKPRRRLIGTQTKGHLLAITRVQHHCSRTIPTTLDGHLLLTNDAPPSPAYDYNGNARK